MKGFWHNNAAFIIFLVAQALFVLVWGVRMEARVSHIEGRGTPAMATNEARTSALEHKLVEQERVVNQLREHILQGLRQGR